jgi:hypothetical protein
VKVIILRDSEFERTWKSLIIFCECFSLVDSAATDQTSAVLSIIMLLITIVFAGILMYNFDRGLKTQREFFLPS